MKYKVLNSDLNITLEDLRDEERVRSAKMEEIDAEQEDIDECEELDAQIEAHKRMSLQRKLESHDCSAKSLREFIVKILEDEVENRLLPVLENAAENNIILDMQEVLRRFAFDTICEVSLGTNPSCLDLSSPVPPLVEAFDGASKFSAMRGVEPVSDVWKCKRALKLGSEKKLKESVNFIHSSVNEIIQANKRKLEKDGANDLLLRFLGAGFDDEMVRDMVISFLMAGRDTTL
ncbi:Cytochrome [Forsythia ovata]|uniref:Cytochrome n=1 Tax=Forsythia ovata TaxID=205694 RepID=A0ABD1SNM5_9LAMI